METTKKQTERLEQFLPNGRVKYVRCYDNGGETPDRYTVVFTGRYRKQPRDQFVYMGISENATGYCQHGESDAQIDRPTYSHLGKKIEFTEMGEGAQKAALETYKDIWGIK